MKNCEFCRGLVRQAYVDKRSAEEKGAWWGPDVPEKRICGESLKVQPVGGGVRFACPKCDTFTMNGLLHISWTNGTPPDSCLCQKPKVLKG